MAEFLGYAGRPKPVSWLDIATKGIENIDTIEKDRQQQREALEKSADDLVKASKEYKPGQSGSLNNLVLQGADRVRNTTLDLKKKLMSGQLTPTEYKSRVANMSEDWKYFGEFAKSYNDIINKGVEYLNDPKASKLGEYFVDKQSKLADVANKQIVVDPSSYNVVMSDPDSGMIVDFKSSLIPENQRPLRLDVINEVERFTKGLGETSRYVNGVWTTSPILKDANEYQKAKANFTKSMLQSSRGAASILSDYVGGYDFYETAQQKKEIEAAGGKAIQLVQGPNGIVTPKLTAAQEKEARDVLDRLVDSRVDVEREQPRPVETTTTTRDSSADGGDGETVKITNRERKLDQLEADITKANAELKGPLEGSTVELIKRRPRKAGGYFYDFYGYQMIPGDKNSSTPEKRLDRKGPRTLIKTVNHTQVKDIYNNILNNKSEEKGNNIDYEKLYQGGTTISSAAGSRWN
jgi:hypothetical protein